MTRLTARDKTAIEEYILSGDISTFIKKYLKALKKNDQELLTEARQYLIKFLKKNSGRINQRDAEGNTLLALALQNDLKVLAKSLLELDLHFQIEDNVELLININNKQRQAPFNIVKNFPELSGLLIRYGIQFCIRCLSDRSLTNFIKTYQGLMVITNAEQQKEILNEINKFMQAHPAMFNACDSKGKTLFELANAHGYSDLATIFLNGNIQRAKTQLNHVSNELSQGFSQLGTPVPVVDAQQPAPALPTSSAPALAALLDEKSVPPGANQPSLLMRPPAVADDDPIFLYLSAMSRYDLSASEGNYEEVLQHRKYITDAGWIKIADSKEQAGDYRGVAFLHPEKKVVIIAHRGTKTSPTSVENIIADYLIATGEVPDIILNAAFQFSQFVYNKVLRENGAGHVFCQTGFSLGGFLATMVGGYFAKHYPQQNGITISIDSPGAEPAARALITKDLIADNTQNTIDYVIRPYNLIGLCNRRMAREVRELTNPHAIQHHQLEILNEFDFHENSSLERLLQIIILLRSHHLDDLIREVNPDATSLKFKRLSSYQVMPYTVITGRQSLDIMSFVSKAGSHALAKMSVSMYQAIANSSEKTQFFALFALLIGGGLGVYHSDKIGKFINDKMNKLTQLVEPYQQILNRLHHRFGIVGFKAGPLIKISLAADEDNDSKNDSVPIIAVGDAKNLESSLQFAVTEISPFDGRNRPDSCGFNALNKSREEFLAVLSRQLDTPQVRHEVYRHMINLWRNSDGQARVIKEWDKSRMFQMWYRDFRSTDANYEALDILITRQELQQYLHNEIITESLGLSPYLMLAWARATNCALRVWGQGGYIHQTIKLLPYIYAPERPAAEVDVLFTTTAHNADHFERLTCVSARHLLPHLRPGANAMALFFQSFIRQLLGSNRFFPSASSSGLNSAAADAGRTVAPRPGDLFRGL